MRERSCPGGRGYFGLALVDPHETNPAVRPTPFCDSGYLLDCVFDRMPVGIVILDRDCRVQHFNAAWLGFARRYSREAAEEIRPGHSFFEIMAGSEPTLGPLFDRVLDGETVEVDNLRLEIDGIDSYWNAVLAPLVADGRAAGIIAMAVDVTRRKQAEDLADAAENLAQARAFQHLEQRVEERTREIERRRRVAEGLRDILAALNSNRSMHAILDAIVTQAGRVLGADIVAIYQLGGDDQLAIQASIGLSQDEIPLMTLSVGQSASGQAVQRRQPVVMVTETEEFSAVLARQKARVPPEGAPILDDMVARIKTMLAVPLTIKDEIYGAIGLYSCAPRVFSDEEIGLALAFADQAALAIENARLRERAEQAAVMEERARLARDLHDSVTQSLYSLTLFSEAARRIADMGDAGRVARYLERLSATALQALKEMRLLVYQLRPRALEREGLVGALQQRLEAVEGRAGILARLLVEGELDLPAAVETELYHIAQEALNNALKHAGAGAVTVRLACQPRERSANGASGARALCLRVIDNGCGFDPGCVREHGGLGLANLRERAARLGGSARIESAPGCGTTIEVCLNL